MAAAEEPRRLKAILRALPPIEDTFSEKGRRWFEEVKNAPKAAAELEMLDMNKYISVVNQFLTVTVHAMANGDQETGTLALQAFQSMLPFCLPNFENQQERDVLMKIIFQLISTPDKVECAALDCLWAMCQEFPEQVLDPVYAQGLLEVLHQVSEANSPAGTRATQFWSELYEFAQTEPRVPEAIRKHFPEPPGGAKLTKAATSRDV
mmetsp:Transcript_65244/g.142286  ORF Transcript_65244/g.142286 Transcript_65244/m.142286 type:complete len:207 (+) Transcript_65244:29-649(+)